MGNVKTDDISTFDLSHIVHLTDSQKEELLELLEMRSKWYKYNKILSFEPYDFQKKFYDASSKYKGRFLCAANR